MSKIRSNGTRFEEEFAEEINNEIKRGYERNAKDILGKPDLLFRKEKVCVFFDSDFWHGWQFPRWKHLLDDYWKEKIEKNRKRDRRTTAKLRRMQWTVVRFWGHDRSNTNNKKKKIKKILSAIQKNEKSNTLFLNEL